jgi:hypothetical protein
VVAEELDLRILPFMLGDEREQVEKITGVME